MKPGELTEDILRDMTEPAELPVRPPPKLAKPTADNVAKLEQWLDVITAFSTFTSDEPWRFYEELDKYLGP